MENTNVEKVETTVENTEVAATEEFSMEQVTKLFSAFEGIKSITKVKEEMTSNALKVTGTEELADKLAERVRQFTPDQIKQLSAEHIEAIYTMEDGVSIEIGLDLTEQKELEFKRDFLVYMRETELTGEQFDKQLEELEKVVKEEQAELDKFLAEFGDLSSFIRDSIQKDYDAAEGEKKEKLGVILAAHDDSYTLNRMVEHYEKYGVATTFNDYKHRSLDVFTRFRKTVAKLNFNNDLTVFNNLEELHLDDEKYKAYPNLFLFAIIKMYSYKKNPVKSDDGVFLSQLAVNIKSLYADSFGSAEKKETFVASIKRVLDVFYPEV